MVRNIKLPAGKNKKVNGLMKDERGGQTVTKFETTPLKTYGYRVQNYDYEIEVSQFIKAKRI